MILRYLADNDTLGGLYTRARAEPKIPGRPIFPRFSGNSEPPWGKKNQNFHQQQQQEQQLHGTSVLVILGV